MFVETGKMFQSIKRPCAENGRKYLRKFFGQNISKKCVWQAAKNLQLMMLTTCLWIAFFSPTMTKWISGIQIFNEFDNHWKSDFLNYLLLEMCLVLIMRFSFYFYRLDFVSTAIHRTGTTYLFVTLSFFHIIIIIKFILKKYASHSIVRGWI